MHLTKIQVFVVYKELSKQKKKIRNASRVYANDIRRNFTEEDAEENHRRRSQFLLI